MAHGALLALHRIECRGPDADAQARKLLPTQVGDGAAQAVVSTCPPGAAQPQAAQGQIHVVNEHQHLPRLEAVPVEGGTDGTPAVVHVGLRHQQTQALLPLTHLRQQTVKLGLLTESGAGTRRESLQGHETNVVPSAGVLLTRVA